MILRNSNRNTKAKKKNHLNILKSFQNKWDKNWPIKLQMADIFLVKLISWNKGLKDLFSFWILCQLLCRSSNQFLNKNLIRFCSSQTVSSLMTHLLIKILTPFLSFKDANLINIRFLNRLIAKFHILG